MVIDDYQVVFKLKRSQASPHLKPTTYFSRPMTNIKLILSLVLWSILFGINHVNADLTWVYDYPPDFEWVYARVDGYINGCGGVRDSSGKLRDLTVLCDSNSGGHRNQTFKHTWINETHLFLLPGYDLPHTFQIPSYAFTVGVECRILVSSVSLFLQLPLPVPFRCGFC